MSLKVKFTLFTSLLCLVVIAGVTALSYRISKTELESGLGMRLEAIVSTAALSIDGDAHELVKGPDDATGTAFLELRDQLRAVKRSNGLDTEVYTFRPKGDELEFVVMTNETPYIGDTYPVRDEMRPTLENGEPAHTATYHDKHGSWISAYAPIMDSSGRVVGLLEADYEVDTLLALLKKKFLRLLAEVSLVAVLAILFSFLLAKGVTKKLGYLTTKTEELSLGQMDEPIEIEGKDEVARLGQSLERMRESLKVAAKLLE
ncbi:MAG: HAMP domain-containing protein [Acidobacteriota bacterium]